LVAKFAGLILIALTSKLRILYDVLKSAPTLIKPSHQV